MSLLLFMEYMIEKIYKGKVHIFQILTCLTVLISCILLILMVRSSLIFFPILYAIIMLILLFSLIPRNIIFQNDIILFQKRIFNFRNQFKISDIHTVEVKKMRYRHPVWFFLLNIFALLIPRKIIFKLEILLKDGYSQHIMSIDYKEYQEIQDFFENKFGPL